MVKSLLEMLTKKRSQTFYMPLDVHSAITVVGESISSISVGNIVKQLGNHYFSCGWGVNNLWVERSFQIK